MLWWTIYLITLVLEFPAKSDLLYLTDKMFIRIFTLTYPTRHLICSNIAQDI